MLQSLKNKKQRFLKVNEGMLIEKTKHGENRFESVSGRLVSIALEQHVNNNQMFLKWHLKMEDADELYDISFGRSSSTFMSVVRFLASDRGLASLNQLTIKTWQKRNGYTNVSVSGSGERLDWMPDAMPALKHVIYNGEDIFDDSDRMAWLECLVAKINDRLAERDTDTDEEDSNVVFS